MADWQPLARAEPLSRALNDTELLKSSIVRLAGEPDLAERQKILTNVLEMIDRTRRAAKDAKREKTESRYRVILVVEALHRDRRRKRTFAHIWGELFKDDPPSESTRERARRWARRNYPAR